MLLMKCEMKVRGIGYATEYDDSWQARRLMASPGAMPCRYARGWHNDMAFGDFTSNTLRR